MAEKTINGVASDKNETGKIPEVSVKSRHVFDKSDFKEIKNKKEKLKQFKEGIKSDHLIQKTDVFHDKFTLSNSKQGSEPANPGRSDDNAQIKSKKTNNVENKHIDGEAPVLSEGEEVSSGFETISSNDSIADYKEIGLSLHKPQCDNHYIKQEENVFSSKYRNNTKTFFNNNSYSFDKSDSKSQHYIKTNRYPYQNYYCWRGYKQSKYYKMYSGYDKNYNYDRYKWSRDKIYEYLREIPTNSKRKENDEYKKPNFLKDTDRKEFVKYSNRSRWSRSRSSSRRRSRCSRSTSSSRRRSRCSHSRSRSSRSISRSSRSRSSSRRRSRFSCSRSRSSHSRSRSLSRRKGICHKEKKSQRNTKASCKRNRKYRRSISSSESSSSESSSSSYSSSSSSSSTSRGSRSPIRKAKKIKPRNVRSRKILKSNHRRNSPVKKRRRSFSKSSLSPENKRLDILEPDLIVNKHENRYFKLLSSFQENDKIKKEKTFLEKVIKNVKIRDRSAAKVSKKKEETKLWNSEAEEPMKGGKSNSRFCINYVPPSFSDILLSSNVVLPSSVDIIPYNEIPSSSNYVPPSSNNVVLSLSEVSPPSNNVPSLNDIPLSSNDAPPSPNEVPPSSNHIPPPSDDILPSNDAPPPPLNDVPPPSNALPPISNDVPPPENDVLPSSNDIPPSTDAPPSNEVPSTSNNNPPTLDDAAPSSNEAPPSNDAPPTPKDAPPSSNEVPPSHDVAPFPDNISFCSYTIPRYPNYIPYHPNAGRMYPWQRFPFPSTPRRSISNLPLRRGPTGLPVHIAITGEVITHDMAGRPIPIGPEGSYQPVDRTGRLFPYILSPKNLPIPIHMTSDGVLRLPNSEPVPYGPGHRFPVDVDGSVITIGPDSRPLGRCSNLPTLPPAEFRQMSNVASTWPKRRLQLIPIMPQTPAPSAISQTNTHQSETCETKKEFVPNETQPTKTENNQMGINKNSYKDTNEDELEILYERKASENFRKPKKNSNSNSYPGAKKLIPITFLPKKMSKEDKNLDSKPETGSKFLPELKEDYVNKISRLECIESILKIACDNKTEEESSTKSKDFIIQKVELAIKSLNDDDLKPPKVGRFIISKFLTQPTEETDPNISPLLKNRIKLSFLTANQNEEKLQTPPKNHVAYKFLPEEITPTKLDKMEEKRKRGVKFSKFSLDFSVQCDFTTVIIKNLTSKVEKMETEVQRLRNINTNLLDGFRNVHMASEKKSEELGKALLEIQEKDNEILFLKSQINEKVIKETSCA